MSVTVKILFYLFPLLTSLYCLEVPDPEAFTGLVEKKAVRAQKFMISAAHPLAAQAGHEILAKGGSAVDALVATQMMLGLVEPQSSGIGGGAFVLVWDQTNKKVHSFDGREMAPKSADEFHFFLDGSVLAWKDAYIGGNSVGIPGVVQTLYLMHQKWGKLPWSELFSGAIQKALEGFIVSQRLSKLIELEINPGIKKLSPAKEYFYPEGVPLKEGDILKNPAYAQILQKIAQMGPMGFYAGDNAEAIISAVKNTKLNPGKLSLQDLKSYQTKERLPVCMKYRKFKVCGMGPPSSGAVAVLQILGILSHFPAEKSDSIGGIHLFAQASRLAFADRDRYLADSDFVSVPLQGLLDSDYLKSRASSIDITKNPTMVLAGFPPGSSPQEDSPSPEFENTSHISIVDEYGNSVSMTTSIENAFGSAVMVNGYLLNNQLTDFSFTARKNNHLIVNRIEPHKRPRSSMAPMMVFDAEDNLVYVTGSPGGSRIISYVARNLIAVLDWELDIQAAANLPHITHRNDYLALEENTSLAQLKMELESMGYEVRQMELNSGIHSIKIIKNGLIGASDPRREGLVLGE